MKHGTAYIQPEDRNALNKLRLSEYRKAEGFVIKDEAVLWNASDEASHVLGVWKSGTLISSMRLEVIQTQKLLEHKIESPIPSELLKEEINFPVGILSKAVTSSMHRSGGLNAHLRYHLFKIAASLGIHHIFGTLVKGAPRSNSLLEMGYTFHSHPTGWTSPFYTSTKEVEIVHLNLKTRGKEATRICAKLAADSLLIYPLLPQKDQRPSL